MCFLGLSCSILLIFCVILSFNESYEGVERFFVVSQLQKLSRCTDQVGLNYLVYQSNCCVLNSYCLLVL